jgi:pimeloyl-ACP methyl ester carboxylesterase
MNHSRRRLFTCAVAIAGALAATAALWHLATATAGLDVRHVNVSGIPVTQFTTGAAQRAPVVVIAHGFAGSQQLMQPFALTLARNGYVVLTFDFPGHGRNASPLPGGLDDHEARTRALLAALDTVAAHGRALAQSDGRLALLGHSMASEIVVRYASEHRDVAATIAVSLFSPAGAPGSARNLLVLDGGLEPQMLIDQGKAVVGKDVAGPVRFGVTYGNVADGSARRIALAAGVEHIGVLYSGASMAEALAWIDDVFGRHGDRYVDARGPWLLLLYAGLLTMAWSLARRLPRIAPTPLGAGCRGRRLVVLAIAPALLTPLILWHAPSAFLPLLLGDYLLLHFALYGLLTASGMALAGVVQYRPQTARGARLKFLIAAAVVAVYAVLVLGAPIDLFVTSVALNRERVPLFFVLLAGTVPYFVADEWLTRGANASRWGYGATKLCLLLSLGAAVALNPARLFFLAIIIPAVLLLFVVYGLLSHWAYRNTNHPLVGALANALAFAWAIAATFPLLGR